MTMQRRVAPYVRFAPLLLVPPTLLASTFPGEYRVPLSYWLLAMAAAAVFAVGDRWPFAVSIVLSALAVPMFAEQVWSIAELVPYLGAVALAEVAMRSARHLVVAAAAVAWTAAVLVGVWLDNHDSFWRAATAITTVAVVAIPLLLGLYLRSQRVLAATYRALAADAESRTRSAERAALARELHDLVAHHMASIVLRIGVAEHVLGGADPRVVAVLDDVHRTASGALTDIRRLLVALRDPDLSTVTLVDPDSVAVEIRAAIERTRAAGFVVTEEFGADIGALDAIGRLTLVRVVQEALTNVMKHAPPGSRAQVSIGREGLKTTLRIVSTTAPTQSTTPGHGVVGMSERVELAGGELRVGPTSDGWEVVGWLPQEAAP
ncbi:two-component sensor histidine kinase [Antrihabitans sp. YC3-6]|uniref:histidine kinase n=1 Tax=Antrihabitans stalagmiti TaxID=2799499 RepID=A0A934NV39_9NOCA|nr:two-component sensor histidine kinase [Antrihabitans stalagmiti]